MARPSPNAIAVCTRAARRLCHLSMRYVGALFEATTGKSVGLLPASHPGLHETRDILNLVLCLRAEQNAITRSLLEAKVVDHARLVELFTEEYIRFGDEKASVLRVELTQDGIVINVDEERKRQQERN